MIQVIEQPDAAVLAQIRDYLVTVPPQAGACPEHDPRWLSVLREGMGHRPMVLLARGAGPSVPMADHPQTRGQHTFGGSICGYLPLALVSGRLFGRFLVSLPYLNRAGVVAQDAVTASALIDHAVELARELNVKYLELRHDIASCRLVSEHPWLTLGRDDKVRMVLDLPPSSEQLWQQIGSKVRNQIRKGDKNGLAVRWGGCELLDAFYDVFAVNMRDLGTPVYPKRLFRSVLGQFPDQAELSVVDYEGQVAAAALLMHDGRWSHVPSASSVRRLNATNANMWMYHQMLLRAMGRGSHEFDFGRSSEDSGTYRFKKQWGAQPRPTVWHYHVRHGDVASMRPDSPRNRRRVAAWKKLPVWLTRRIGPVIVKGIP